MAKATKQSATVTRSADVTDATVTRMGRALAEIAELEKELTTAVSTLESEHDRMRLADQADRAIAEAVEDQGLSLIQFHQVVRAADSDPELRERLTAAIRAA